MARNPPPYRLRARMRHAFRIALVIAATAVLFLAVAHEIAWYMPVDSYNYVEQTTSGQILLRQTSIDSANASDVRQLINSQPVEPLISFCEHGLNDTRPQNLIYTYTFRLHGIVIETVSGKGDDCHRMRIQCAFAFPVSVDGNASNLPSNNLG